MGRRLPLLLAAIALLAWAAAAAIGRAESSLHLAAAVTEIGTWSPEREPPQRGTWEAVHEELERALATDPRDPSTHELLGLLGSLRKDSAEAMAGGVAHFVTALVLRPTSPYAWAHLAEAKYRRGEPGANLQLAFARAAELGPHEPGVQRILADYGLAVYDEVDAPTRALLERVLAAGFRRNSLEMLQIAERRGRLDVACRHLVSVSRKADPAWSSLCGDAGRQP